MEQIVNFLTGNKIPIGAWGKQFFTFLTTNFAWFFDSIARGLTFILESIVVLLLWFPPLVLVAAETTATAPRCFQGLSLIHI